MHHADLILTVTAGLAAALVLGYVTHRLGLSPIVGYLLAGVVLSPTTPGFAANRDLADQLAEIGVILLMFGVGLHFHFRELLNVRRVAIPGAIGQSLLATLLGALVGLGFGWNLSSGVVFGLAVSVASTVVLLRVLVDNKELHTPTGHIAVGWLVVEDLFTVFVLVLLPVLAPPAGAEESNIALELAWSALKIVILVLFVVLVGGRFMPWLLAQVAATRSRELFTLTVLVLALGIAFGAAKVFGVSMALGAFLAGMVVGRSDFSSRAASEALPMRDAFAVLFFVSVGMRFNPRFLLDSPHIVGATLAIILIGKPLAAFVIVVLLKYPVRVALSVAVALAQIGEFSFILAAMASQLSLLTDDAANALIPAALVSISLNPILFRLVRPIENALQRHPGLWRWLSPAPTVTLPNASPASSAEEVPQRGQAVVVGYGPVGRTLVRLLRESGVEPTVIELNFDTVQRLREDGIAAVYGDATHLETIKEAGVERALVFILSSAGMRGSEEVIRLVREANPGIRVFARANYLREAPALRKSGADVVFAGEGEVALSMTESLLRYLGATDEQLDREEDRIRKDLFGTPFTLDILLPPPQPKRDPPETDSKPEQESY
jgi:CPA2 family monovalent cation:H+ antiporter-2